MQSLIVSFAINGGAPVLGLTRNVVLVVGFLGIASDVEAQRGKKEPLEFTRQGLLIVNFIPGPGADLRLGRRAADAVRDRVAKLVNKREVEVIDGDDIRTQLERAGYNPDTTFAQGEAHAIGRFLRADEFLIARVTNGPSGPRISGQLLLLLRDENLRQPLPEVGAAKLDSAAMLFAKASPPLELSSCPSDAARTRCAKEAARAPWPRPARASRPIRNRRSRGRVCVGASPNERNVERFAHGLAGAARS